MTVKNEEPSKIRQWAESINSQLKDLGPVRLQDIRLYGEEMLALGLYREGLTWLVFDLNLSAPQIYSLEDITTINKKDHKKPLSLFMHAHFRGLHLLNVETREQFGRVLWVNFGTNDQVSAILEVRLFARGANAIATLIENGVEKKIVALRKPLPLREVLGQSDDSLAKENQKPDAKINNSALPRAIPVASSIDHRLQIKQSKIEKALGKVEEEIKKKSSEDWQIVGELLKKEQSLNIAPEYSLYVDKKRSLAWNMQNCFQKSKALKAKLSGTIARREQLRKELLALTSDVAAGPLTGQKSQPNSDAMPKKKLLESAEARGRTFELTPDFFLFVGKSAVDNLRILRQAKAWHYWLHLRDYPGAHGIISRNKNQLVSDAVLQRAAHHLLVAQFASKAERHYGDKFTILVAECRFVRPIKGDRLGRVTHSNARTFTHQFAKNLDEIRSR